MSIFIIDTLKQKNNGIFPLIDSNDIQGGFYQVDTIQERDNIPSIRRKEGMLCWVSTEKTMYQLNGGTENIYWIEFKVGSSDTGGTVVDDKYSHIWVGTQAPEDTKMIWIDTRADGILEDETPSDMETVRELMTLINELKDEVDVLKRKVKYLEENGVVAPGGGSTGNGILLEDGTSLLLEDGTELLLEG